MLATYGFQAFCPQVGREVVELEVVHGVPLVPEQAHILDVLGDEGVLHAVNLVANLRADLHRLHVRGERGGEEYVSAVKTGLTDL